MSTLEIIGLMLLAPGFIFAIGTCLVGFVALAREIGEAFWKDGITSVLTLMFVGAAVGVGCLIVAAQEHYKAQNVEQSEVEK
jgi:hypothetical protein